MISTRLYVLIVALGLVSRQVFSKPQGISFGEETNADSNDDENLSTRQLQQPEFEPELKPGDGGRLGLVADILGTHPTGGDTFQRPPHQGNESPSQRQTQHCCCVGFRDSCPIDRNSGGSFGGNSGGSFGGNSGGSSSGGSFGGSFGGSPRIRGTNITQEDDLPEIAVRIVNNPTEFSQPQVQLENYCEQNERRCCYSSNSELNRITTQSRCIERTRQVQPQVSWQQNCGEQHPRGIRQNEKRCGERRFQEIDGKEKGEANPGEFPWTCLILNQNNDFVGACAIVPDNYSNDIRRGTDRVITAAHKLKKIKERDTVKVRVIEYDARGFRGPESTKHREYVVKEMITHRDYNSDRLSYDLAVLKVEGRIELTSTDDINAACIPQCGNMFDYQFRNGTGVRCWVAGWGKDSSSGSFQVIQNKVDVPILPNRDDCQRRMQRALGNAGRNFRLSPSEICAGGEEGKDACDGDGGAPLVCKSDENRWHVVGLVTWGVDCAQKGVPGIYANIYEMRDFIMRA